MKQKKLMQVEVRSRKAGRDARMPGMRLPT